MVVLEQLKKIAETVVEQEIFLARFTLNQQTALA